MSAHREWFSCVSHLATIDYCFLEYVILDGPTLENSLPRTGWNLYSRVGQAVRKSEKRGWSRISHLQRGPRWALRIEGANRSDNIGHIYSSCEKAFRDTMLYPDRGLRTRQKNEFNDSLTRVLHSLDRGDNVILLGDFNAQLMIDKRSFWIRSV